MKIHARPSTAQQLGMFREALATHYRGLRSESPLARKTPLPTVEQFTGYAREMAVQISNDELNKHNQAVQEIERQKKLTEDMNK